MPQCATVADLIFGAGLGLNARMSTDSNTHQGIDFLSGLNPGDSFFKTAKSRRENVPCSVHVAVVFRAAFAASPCSYSQTRSTFRTAGGNAPAARTSLG